MLKFTVSVLGLAEGAALPVTFDEALASLELLSRMFIEPDGSFVWTGDDGGERWQVDGNLIDRGECLAYVELSGCCPESRFDEVLGALGWPESPLWFQLPRRGVTHSEAEFRQLAASDAGAV